MAFGAITTVYLPIAGSAGASLWGTDVRKVLSSADATADTTSTTVHGTGGDTRRTVDPFTASSTDATEADYGFAIQPSDMGSTSVLKRRQAAGNHVLTARLSHSATAGDSTATLHFLAYRVASAAASRARTLLGSVNQAISLAALGAEGTFTATIALSDIVYENDETVQYSSEITATGQIATGASTTFRTGTSGGVAIRIDFPRLDTITEFTGTSAGTSEALAVTGKVLPMTGTAVGEGIADGVTGSIAGTTGSAAGTSTALAETAAVKQITGTAAGTSEALGLLAKILPMTGTVEIGAGGGETIVRRKVIIFD